MCKKSFAKKSDRDRHIHIFYGSQFQISDEVSDEIATNYDELKNDMPTMATPPRFFLENVSDGIATDRDQSNNDVPTMVTPPTTSGLEDEIIDFNISGDIWSHQPVKSVQDDDIQCNLPTAISKQHRVLKYPA